MSDYKEIVGTRVKAVSANPSDALDGEVWYNTTDAVLKYKKAIGGGAWSSGGNLNTGRTRGGHIGIQTAALYVAGTLAPGPGRIDNVESYNGSSWTEVADVPTNRTLVEAAGTQTAGVAFGGEPRTGDTQTWNGSSWTEVNNMNTGRENHGSCGETQTNALAFGGSADPSATSVGICESWNGTSWTEVADFNSVKESSAGSGTNTAALSFGGGVEPNEPAGIESVESFNGTSWTEVADLNTPGTHVDGAGTQTAALLMGRFHPSSPNWPITEAWNGSSWSEVGDLSTGRYFNTGGGTQSAGLLAGGQAGPGGTNKQDTEEFSTIFNITVE